MNIVRQRLANQFLTSRGPASASQVVAALGAVQSQDFTGALWALGQRVPDATETGVEREFAEGHILRTHVLRPTWHFVSPADIRWMLALTAPRVKSAMASYDRKLELTEAVYRRSNAALAKALSGGRHRTRAELRMVLERAHVGVLTTQRMAHLMMGAELDAVVCSGPRRGKHFTYALLEERVPTAPPQSREASLAELARRYFTTRGPATASDFAWWSGLSMADVRAAIGALGTSLDRVTMHDREYLYVGRDDIPSVRSAHLLPNYDEYFIGFKDRSAIGERLRSVRQVTGGSALIANVIAMNGQLVGGWKRSAGSRVPEIRLRLLDTLSQREDQFLARALRRYGEFLCVTPVVHRTG